MDEFANIVNTFERSLGRPMVKSELLRSPLTAKELGVLAEETRQEYNKEVIPPKKNKHEIRPFIDPKFNMGIMDYAMGGNIAKSFDNFIFDKTISGKMIGNIKQILLYSHSIVINDPLDYVLDFFHRCEDGNLPKYITGRVELANSLLVEYSEMSDLIKSKIVIPVEYPANSGNNTPYIGDTDFSALAERLKGKISAKELKFYEHVVHEVIRTQKELGDDVDYFFPEQEYIHVLKETLKSTKQKFLSNNIESQSNTAFLTKLKIIDLNNLNIKDIINIRQNEEIFEEWRAFLSTVLKITAENIDNCLDPSDEFISVINAELNNKNNEINKRIKRSSWGKNLIESIQDMGIGTIAGTLSVLPTGNLENIPTGALAGASESIIKFGIKSYDLLKHRKSSTALRRHFLTMGGNFNK